MGRAPRIEPVEGVVHITVRGVRRLPIYVDDLDRRMFMGLLGQTAHRCRWSCLAYCLMTNHFHLVVALTNAQLSRGMHRLNWMYALRFNERYGHSGHLFEARFGSRTIDTETQLLETLRYVVSNPVRAGICADPADWPWSSFRATAGLERCPPFLAGARVRSSSLAENAAQSCTRRSSESDRNFSALVEAG